MAVIAQRGAKGFWYAADGSPLGWFIDCVLDDAGAYQGAPPLPNSSAVLAEWRATASLTKIQLVRAMRALHVNNDPGQPKLWAAHGAKIEAHPDWPYVTVIPRLDPLTLAAAATMTATPEQMDAIWQLGATL